MPKGQTIINWTAENDAKLFLTVLAVQKIQVDYENVAKAFGKPEVFCLCRLVSSCFDKFSNLCLKDPMFQEVAYKTG